MPISRFRLSIISERPSCRISCCVTTDVRVSHSSPRHQIRDMALFHSSHDSTPPLRHCSRRRSNSVQSVARQGVSSARWKHGYTILLVFPPIRPEVAIYKLFVAQSLFELAQTYWATWCYFWRNSSAFLIDRGMVALADRCRSDYC